MVRVGFRAAWRATLPDRILDLCCHALLAYALPGHWWFQFLPDVMLPEMWLHGMVVDAFKPSWSLPLAAHRFLHLRGTYQVPALTALVFVTVWWPELGGMWLAHVAVDSVTHGEGWQ